ncbi:hypothetical protein GON26_14365, partial [Flavobacterium sp. GA093]
MSAKITRSRGFAIRARNNKTQTKATRKTIPVAFFYELKLTMFGYELQIVLSVFYIEDLAHPGFQPAGYQYIIPLGFFLFGVIEFTNEVLRFIYPKFDVADVKFDMADVKFDITDVKFDITDVKFDVADAKFDITDVKFDMVDAKFDVTDAKFDVTDAKFDVTDAKFDMADVKFGVIQEYWNVYKVMRLRKTGEKNAELHVTDEKFHIADVK